jgi:hypothetical protein
VKLYKKEINLASWPNKSRQDEEILRPGYSVYDDKVIHISGMGLLR